MVVNTDFSKEDVDDDESTQTIDTKMISSIERTKIVLSRTKPVPIIVGYDESMRGKLISKEHVIRAKNGYYYTEEECMAFRQRSTAGCPTYGNCNKCFQSGPVGQRCNRCRSRNSGYMIIVTQPPKKPQLVIDAEYFGKMCGEGHQVAMADRVHKWIEPPTYFLAMDDCFMVTLRGHSDIKDPQEQHRLRWEAHNNVKKNIFDGKEFRREDHYPFTTEVYWMY